MNAPPLLITLLALSSYSLAGPIPTFAPPVYIEIEGEPLTIPSRFIHPTFADLNKDGLNDLIVGEPTNGGQVLFYENIGSKTQPEYASAKAEPLMMGGEILSQPSGGG